MSKKSSLKAEYDRMGGADSVVQTCAVCKTRGPKSQMHRHHVNGRSGIRLLEYIYVCPLCHEWIHQNPAKAKELNLYHTRP